MEQKIVTVKKSVDLYIRGDEHDSNVSAKTFKMPKSSVLERVQNFIPVMASANKELESQISSFEPGHFDIENTEKFDGPVIEMNIGMFERDNSEESSSDSDESEADCNCDELNCSCTKTAMFSTIGIDTIKLPHTKNSKANMHGAPLIQVLKKEDLLKKDETEINK